MERVSKIERKTSETEIVLELNLDGKGLCSVNCEAVLRAGKELSGQWGGFEEKGLSFKNGELL